MTAFLIIISVVLLAIIVLLLVINKTNNKNHEKYVKNKEEEIENIQKQMEVNDVFENEIRKKAQEKSIENFATYLNKGEYKNGLIILNMGDNKSFVSEGVQNFLDINKEFLGFKYEKENIEKKIEGLIGQKNDDFVQILISGKNNEWLDLKRFIINEQIIIFISDVSANIEMQKQMLYNERYDSLTGLYNHTSFMQKLDDMFKMPKSLGISAVVLFELEDIKVINDNYGLEAVNKYIQQFVDVIKANELIKGFFSRYGNSEFFAFFYGYPTEESLKSALDNFLDEIKNAEIKVNDVVLKLNISTAIAWYPKNSEKYSDLLNYANFTLYMGQKIARGKVMEFDYEQYLKDGYLLNNREEFANFLQTREVKYVFQPIVDVKTAKVYGYEMLMRPQMDKFKNPAKLVNLARMEAKLGVIENITWFEGMKAYIKAVEDGFLGYKTKVFINSVGGAVLSIAELDKFYEEFFDYLQNIVIEITETEQDDAKYMQVKRDKIKEWKAQIAIDKYGSGYNSELSLDYFEPSVVKIDMDIIHGVNNDENRQNVLKSLISYAKNRNVKILAEGIETKEELKMVIEYGVDYVQGYYLGMPEFTPKDLTVKQKSELGDIYRNKK